MLWLFQKKVYLKSNKMMIRKGKELFYKGRKIKILSIKNDYVKVKNFVKNGCSISLIPLETFIEDVNQDSVYVCK